jgi:hypothetical protein
VKARQRRVPKDKATGLPKKYVSGAKNKSAKAAELKRTAEAYKRGESIDIHAVSKSRTVQGGTRKASKRVLQKKLLGKKPSGSRFTYGQLAASVPIAAKVRYLSSGSRNVPMTAWAMGRVISLRIRQGGCPQSRQRHSQKN